jgi:hypothetical protein
MVVASVALLVALGGTSVAAVNQLAANSVGTSQLKSNAVTTPKIKNSAVNASKLASNAVTSAKIAGNAVNSSKIANATIQPADLSAAAKTSGPQGAPGPQGPSGPAGAAAAAGWASVDSVGNLVRNRSAVSSQRNGTGSYQVIFSQDVTGCVYLSSPGGPTTATFTTSDSGAAQLPNVPAGVRVETRNSVGTLVDLPFFLAVFC